MSKKANKCERSVRDALGLPRDVEMINALAPDNAEELCENTVGYAHRVQKNDFDYGASGGATSPNTEVNAESQGIISEAVSSLHAAPTELGTAKRRGKSL